MEINSPAYKGIKRYQDGDNAMLRKVIVASTPKAVEQMCPYAEQFRGKDDLETCRNIWNFLKTKIKYVADQEYQIVRLPSALLKTKEGDCKSYSVFTSAVLQCLGIPHYYAMTSYNKTRPTPSHIYVVTDSGIIIDAVWHSFNSEKPYAYIYKIKPYKTMKTNTGLGGTAIPPFKIGMGAIPSFQGRGSAIPTTKIGLGDCGCGCGGKCGMGAITKQQLNKPLREIILLFFKANIGGFATKFQNAGIGDDKLGRWYTEMGGNGQEVWAAIKEGSSKPVIAKWFSNSIRNKVVRQLKDIQNKRKGIGGYYGYMGATEPTKAELEAEKTEEANTTNFQNSDDIIAAVMTGDYALALRLLSISLGALAANLIPACNVDPTQVTRAICSTGGGIIGNVFYALMKEFIRVLFPKPPAPPKLEWSTLKVIVDNFLKFDGATIDNATKTICEKFPNMAYNNFPCKFLVGKTTYDQEVMTSALMIYYLNASRTSDALATTFAEYLRSKNKGQGVVAFHDKAMKEKNTPLPPVEGEGGGGGTPQTAGTGLAIALVGAIFLLSMGKKGVKGKRL
jgi:hypothetical protein